MNKKFLLLISFSLFGFSKAQENSVKLNPFGYFGGADMVTYEKKLGNHSSGLIGAAYGQYKLDDVKYKNLGVGLQYRYYIKESIKGLYLAGTAEYRNGKAEIEETKSATAIKYGGFSIGARGGYQYILKSGFTLDFNLGFGYDSYNYKFASITEEALYLGMLKERGLSLRGSLGLGYSF